MRTEVLYIEDDDDLYRRIHRTQLKNEEVLPAAFVTNRQPDNSISVDLARLTTPDETLSRGRKCKSEYGLGVLCAQYPRTLGFTVRHRPSHDNHAHTLVEGQNTRTKCHLLARATSLLRRPGG